MCIPSPQTPAVPPTNVASMQAADNLQLGGSQRGAAQIGRLALRLGAPGSGDNSSAATGSSANTGSTTPPAVTPPPVATSASTGTTASTTTPQQLAGGGVYLGGGSGNQGLRLGSKP